LGYLIEEYAETLDEILSINADAVGRVRPWTWNKLPSKTKHQHRYKPIEALEEYKFERVQLILIKNPFLRHQPKAIKNQRRQQQHHPQHLIPLRLVIRIDNRYHLHPSYAHKRNQAPSYGIPLKPFLQEQHRKYRSSYDHPASGYLPHAARYHVQRYVGKQRGQ